MVIAALQETLYLLSVPYPVESPNVEKLHQSLMRKFVMSETLKAGKAAAEVIDIKIRIILSFVSVTEDCFPIARSVLILNQCFHSKRYYNIN